MTTPGRNPMLAHEDWWPAVGYLRPVGAWLWAGRFGEGSVITRSGRHQAEWRRRADPVGCENSAENDQYAESQLQPTAPVTRTRNPFHGAPPDSRQQLLARSDPLIPYSLVAIAQAWVAPRRRR